MNTYSTPYCRPLSVLLDTHLNLFPECRDLMPSPMFTIKNFVVTDGLCPNEVLTSFYAHVYREQ